MASSNSYRNIFKHFKQHNIGVREMNRREFLKKGLGVGAAIIGVQAATLKNKNPLIDVGKEAQACSLPTPSPLLTQQATPNTSTSFDRDYVRTDKTRVLTRTLTTSLIGLALLYTIVASAELNVMQRRIARKRRKRK